MITIPGRILRFLEQYANLAFAGTRDRDLVPYGHRVSGWLVGADGRTLTALVAEHFTANLVESLRGQRRVRAHGRGVPVARDLSVQGPLPAPPAVQREDIEVVDRIRERFLKSVRHVYTDAPEHLLNAYIQTPGLAVEFDVREIFLQTPGPGAGDRLVPPAETLT